jgi:hypothetical protein
MVLPPGLVIDHSADQLILLPPALDHFYPEIKMDPLGEDFAQFFLGVLPDQLDLSAALAHQHPFLGFPLGDEEGPDPHNILFSHFYVRDFHKDRVRDFLLHAQEDLFPDDLSDAKLWGLVSEVLLGVDMLPFQERSGPRPAPGLRVPWAFESGDLQLPRLREFRYSFRSALVLHRSGSLGHQIC